MIPWFASLLACIPTSLADSWHETGSFAAPEANQAAAADLRFFYAVTNREIAKYDRRSGQRIATSAGEAAHLNSAFLWQGRLYCAHSNYPHEPELSQVKTLDVETMKLTTAHDFAEFVGSLTWVVRHDDAWWCNFARYDDDNRLTMLVRCDDDWQETGRWTYPREVLAELGTKSVSGGVWRGDLLYVTDHDNRRLYRLRLPKTGGVLEFVDRQDAPFTGQGIAADPLTGGLVGIDRGEKRVVFARLAEPVAEFAAEGPIRLRVLTYNIHHGEGTDGKLDLARIAGVIGEVAPDIVALQEVDRRAARTGNVDQPAELAKLTGMNVAFGANIPLQGGHYGNAVLARLPIAREENRLLPSIGGGEQRGVLDVRLKLPGGDDEVRLLATHLDARGPNAERLASADAINELLARDAATPTLLAGDLNDTPASEVLRRFEAAWQIATREPHLTSPAGKPRRQIDFALSSPANRWRVVETRALDEAVASDHRPLLVVIELLPESADAR